MTGPSSSRSSSFDPAVLGERLSRRRLLQRGAGGLAGLGLAPALLAACGGDDDGGEVGEVGGTVRYLGYEGEEFPEVLSDFNASHGISFESEYIGAISDIPAMLRAGGGTRLDVVDFSAPATRRLIESGVEFPPLDLDRIPNWRNVEEFIGYTGAEAYSNANGEIVGAPLVWGALGITYDSSAIDEPKAWGDLLEPEFRGQITTVDDPSQNFALAAEILGYRSNQLTRDQLAEVSDYLTRIVANSRQLSPTYGDMTNLLVSGEITAAFVGWSAVNAFAASAGNDAIRTNLRPEEGSAVFVELWSLGPDAENADTVYALINELLEPEMNAAAADSVLSAPTVIGAQAFQDEEVASLYPSESDYEAYFSESSVAIEPPVESDEYVTFAEVTEAWERIKADAA